MKAMIMSDLLIAKKYLWQQLGIATIVGVFLAIMMGNLYVVSPMIGVMVPFSLTITILALDERANWQQFRLALPISRTDMITGRYVSFGLLALCGIAVGLLATFLIIAAAQIVPNVPQLADLMVNLSWQTILFPTVIGLVMVLLMLSITMPLFSRFGMTKGVRYLPLVIIFGVWIGFSVGGSNLSSEFFVNLKALLETTLGAIGVAAALLAAIAVLYAISAVISVRLYKKREL